MNYRGSYKKLLGNSKAAMIAAIEIYNKPMFQYRDECTVILLLNAWELVLKALLSKNHKSIYYPKKKNHPYRTLSWQDALSKGKDYFPSEIPHLPIQLNLELLGTYRDNAVHFYNARDFSTVLYGLAQTSIMNFRDILQDLFGINLVDLINWQLLPIGIRPPIDVVSYISGKSDATMTTAVYQFLSELSKAIEQLKAANQDTGRLLTIYDVKLESIKKIGEADVVVAIGEGTTQEQPLAIVRPQDPNKSHPLRQTEILKRIDSLHGKSFNSYMFQAIIWKYGIKEKPQYCWRASEGILTRYSNDTVTFIQRLTSADVDALIIEYREFRRLRSKRKVS